MQVTQRLIHGFKRAREHHKVVFQTGNGSHVQLLSNLHPEIYTLKSTSQSKNNHVQKPKVQCSQSLDISTMVCTKLDRQLPSRGPNARIGPANCIHLAAFGLRSNAAVLGRELVGGRHISDVGNYTVLAVPCNKQTRQAIIFLSILMSTCEGKRAGNSDNMLPAAKILPSTYLVT